MRLYIDNDDSAITHHFSFYYLLVNVYNISILIYGKGDATMLVLIVAHWSDCDVVVIH